jgi:hypothetical protein
MRLATLGAATALVLFAAGAACAAEVHYKTTLKGSNEVPANGTTGTGKVEATLDTATKTLTYTVTFSGLSGPVTMAHFHGPAGAGANAPPVIVVKDFSANPMTGSATLTDAQIADLKAGNWYFNVHTAAHPPGEIRGQLELSKASK